MQSRALRIAQFWIVLIWTLFTVYLAYLGWPGTYGPEFGDFLIHIGFLGLCPFALGAVVYVVRRNIQLARLMRDPQVQAEKISVEAIRKARR
ncbi:hypothetical protein PAERUG_P40_Scotland_4_VIM_2_09_12_04127 [Pseudomonas aeruginosa]|nr:hypothetical protein [Pseudomonas aeruginosa]CRN67569.1 hypothetical protein PAERUG_P40_Scotland_4_VIM_2_09_12_04127 [Pseudomonas aeruginosa]